MNIIVEHRIELNDANCFNSIMNVFAVALHFWSWRAHRTFWSWKLEMTCVVHSFTGARHTLIPHFCKSHGCVFSVLFRFNWLSQKLPDTFWNVDPYNATRYMIWTVLFYVTDAHQPPCFSCHALTKVSGVQMRKFNKIKPQTLEHTHLNGLKKRRTIYEKVYSDSDNKRMESLLCT